MNNITAISPIDGRYANKTEALCPLFSEWALIRYRLKVEIQWLIFLSETTEITEIPPFSLEIKTKLTALVDNFSLEDALKVKELEKTTNHDVKALEYFIQDYCKSIGIESVIPFIHFACTSEDINNTAYALMLQDGRDQILLPYLNKITSQIDQFAQDYRHIPMLSRTHGQTASPTTVGKEWANFHARLKHAMIQLQSVKLLGKFNGATGNYNAHAIAYPELNWAKLSRRFIEQHLGLTFNPMTTQIEPHDFVAELLDALARSGNILLDLSRDIWLYIAIDYFKQKKQANEIGSSTMPHKVNPIDFENAEGNLQIVGANAHMMRDKLPISRWQRDLSDSTVFRNLGVVFAHAVISYESLLKGLSKLELNEEKIKADLDNAWEVLAEAAQTLMRRHGISDAYEQLKAISRGEKLDQATYLRFVDQVPLPESEKARLRALTPATYIGLATKLF